MELGIIRQINIDAEMQASYLDYAMSVIVARALPDVRDGLKPVHRRILYAMHDLGIQPDKPYKKSARIVGEVLGKYHPHGDAAVYEAMVRMAQDFSLRYPLVDGQGNFGSIDGDNAAAMRYTEARLAKIATEMLGDIEKDTVDWTENFDGTLKEPTVLPAALPNLLVNGASGIAVGMSTNVPPHNLGEVCDALCHLIDNHDRHDDVTVEDLLQFIPGPDFPTGGVIYRYQRAGNGDAAEQVDVIAHAYAGGKGSIVMQAKAHIEDMSRNRSRIVVTELPYQTNKTTLLERIAELVRDGRLEGITDLRDESDRTGMRICIEMTRTVEPRQVLADLFKLTPLQQTFGVSMLALVADETGRLEPRLLSLKRMLLHFLEHRQEVIVRRSRFELEKARQRAHILEGLLRALDVLDEIIALIRKSRTADDAKQGLIKQFNFTEIQAQAILDMQLRRLAALERRKLQDEYREVIALIRELEALLNSPKKVLALIRQNLVDLKARYGDARRTQIADRVQGTLTTHDLLPDEDVWVTLSSEGQLTRWRRGAEVLAGKGGPPHLRAAAPLLVSANTRDDLYLFSARGQATRIGIHQIPEGSGSHLADLSGFNRRDRVAALIALPKPGEQPSAPSFLLLATAQGKVKRVALADLADQAQTDPQVIGLDAGDELVWANVSAGGGEVLLVTAQGQAIRFSEEDVRGMGLPAGGIGGIKLGAKDRVVAGAAFGPAASAAHLVLVTALGFAKRTPLADFPAQGRNGQGVVAAKLTPKSGAVAGAALLAADDAVLCVLSGGGNRVLHPDDLPEMGRAATGKQVAGLGGLLTVERVLLLAGAGAVSPAEPEPAPPAPAGKAAAKPKTAPRQPAQSAVKPARSRSASPPAAAEAAKPARRAASTPQAETPAQAPTRPTRGRTTSTTPTRQVGAGSPRPQSAPKPDSAAQSKAGAAEAPKPARTRAKTASVDAAQLALLAETPPDAPEKKPRAAARGKAAPATPAEPPKATSSKAKGVTQAQPEPAAAPAKPAGRPAKQAAASSAPAEPARPGALTATKTATKTPAPPVKATPVPSAAQDKAADKTKPPDKPAAPASKAPVASRKGGTRKSGS